MAMGIDKALVFLLSHQRIAFPVLIVLACWLMKSVNFHWQRRKAQKKMLKRRDEAQERKARVRHQYSNDTYPALQKPLTERTVHELLTVIRNNEVTAVQVLHSFQKKAMELSDEINCVVEPISEAEKEAKQLDDSQDKSRLLHGIPVSIKENIEIAGYDSTAGMSVFIGNIAREDAVVVKVLKMYGALPFVRTNVPQTMLSYCCANPLYGETLNPIDKTRIPGGSSGGEAAILCGGGAVIGLGTDVGGSVRVPAEFCGIYALKTTRGRISTKGTLSLSRGNLAIRGVVGPMARDFDSLVHLSRVLMSPEMIKLDGTVPYLPFRMEVFESTKPLRIGYYTYDGRCQCQPPIVRAVLRAKRALEAVGHEVVEFDYPSLLGSDFDNGEYYLRFMTADGNEKLKRLLQYDDLEPALSMLRSKVPRLLLVTLYYLWKEKYKHEASPLCAALGFGSIYDYFSHVSQFLDWQDKSAKVWMNTGLDAVICPVFPSPAVRRDIGPKVSACGLYCQMYNSLNYPSGAMPITKVTQEDLDKTYNPAVFSAKSSYEKLLLESSKNSTGLSVGVQCVCLPFQEEVCLRVMKDIEQGLKHVS